MDALHRMLVVAILFTAVAVSAVSAQSINDERDRRKLQRIEQNVPMIRGKATELDGWGNDSFYMALAIGILGLCSAALPQIPNSPKSLGTAVGLLVGALTLINAKFFVFDATTLHALAKNARDSVDVLDDQAKQYHDLEPTMEQPATREESERILHSVAHLQQELNGLERRANEGGYTLNVNTKVDLIREEHGLAAASIRPAAKPMLFGETALMAAEQKPRWVDSPPYDASQVGVVGIGGCSTLTAAREMARYNAIETMARRLVSSNSGLNLDATMTALERNAQESRNYSFKDGTGLYWHHMLISFRRSILTRDIVDTPDGPSQAPVHNDISLPIPSSGSSRVVASVISAKPQDGSFDLIGNLSREATNRVRFVLTGINVRWDGSVGTTKWIFRIGLGDQALSIPVHRYEDQGRPTRCVLRPEEQQLRQVSASVAATTVKLGIDAIRPN